MLHLDDPGLDAKTALANITAGLREQSVEIRALLEQ